MEFKSTPLNPTPEEAPLPPSQPAPVITPEPDQDALRHLDHPKAKKALRWVMILAGFLLIVSVVSFWFKTPTFSESQVVLNIEGPTQALSGDEVTYKLKYENNTRLELNNIRIRFFYPDAAVVIKDDQVSNDTSEELDIASLPAGQKGEKDFTVFLVGDKGNIKEAKAHMVFNAGSLTSDFQKDVSVVTTVTGSPVALTLVAPPSAVSGQPISYLLDYRNESAGDLSDLLFVFAFPDGFTMTKSTPAANAGAGNWSVATLKQGSGSRITIEGIISGQERESKNISVTLKRKVNGKYADYEKADTSTIISSPLLNVSMTVNGANDYTAVPGDTLRYVINYKNSYTQTLSGLTLAVKLDGDMYDLSTLDPQDGFFDNSSNTIVWNSGSTPALASLPPGQSGQAKFNIRLKSNLASVKNFSVKATGTISTDNVPASVDANQISAQNALSTKVSTKPTLAQNIYYNDPATGASGTLPPQVGKATVYTVHWQITNPGNSATGVKIVGTLPTGVVWKDVVSANSTLPVPVFNKNTSQVSWIVGVVPQGTGLTSGKFEGTFQISLTPSSVQKGSPVGLIRGVSFSGVDALTNQSIIVPVRDYSTNDLFDAPGQGIVQ